MSGIIEKELSYRLTGCIFDVHNEVGPGLREECYQKAMEIRLGQAAIPFIAKPHTRRELAWLDEVADVFGWGQWDAYDGARLVRHWFDRVEYCGTLPGITFGQTRSGEAEAPIAQAMYQKGNTPCIRRFVHSYSVCTSSFPAKPLPQVRTGRSFAAPDRAELPRGRTCPTAGRPPRMLPGRPAFQVAAGRRPWCGAIGCF